MLCWIYLHFNRDLLHESSTNEGTSGKIWSDLKSYKYPISYSAKKDHNLQHYISEEIMSRFYIIHLWSSASDRQSNYLVHRRKRNQK